LAGLAPFLVAGFLFSLAAVFRFGQVRLGLESYLLAGCGLALFFPLLIFVSGMVGLLPASIVALLLVSGLELVFLGLAAGWQKTRWRVGLLLIVFLGFFSLGVLSAWQGLMLTCGGVLLVGTFMLLYARRPVAAEPEPQSVSDEADSEVGAELLPGAITPESELAPLADEMEPEPDPTMLDNEVGTDLPDLYCPFCSRALDDDYGFCPGCGHDTKHCRRCRACGAWQFAPAELDEVHCVHCGEALGGAGIRPGATH
jgi:hypothetical protein